MQSINLFNSIEKLRGGFLKEAEDQGISVKLYRTRNIIIHLKNKEVAKFVHSEEFVEINNHVNFFQIRGRERHIPAIIAMYCDFYNIPFNDPINTEHTLHV